MPELSIAAWLEAAMSYSHDMTASDTTKTLTTKQIIHAIMINDDDDNDNDDDDDDDDDDNDTDGDGRGALSHLLCLAEVVDVTQGGASLALCVPGWFPNGVLRDSDEGSPWAARG